MSFAAHEKLDNLILLFDSNDVTLDKMAEFTQVTRSFIPHNFT